VTLNSHETPGPWNIKEHVLVYIMANVAVGAPYALNTIVVSELYYGIEMGYWFSLTVGYPIDRLRVGRLVSKVFGMAC
jgi:OPT oligopeptide transporter protein